MRPVLCAVTDRQRFRARAAADDLAAFAAAAAKAGIQLLQIRERDLDGAELRRIVGRCVEAVQGSRTRVIVNDRLDVAMASGAHGVHLPGHGVPAARVRAVVPPGFLVGRSVHHASEAARVTADGGLDYLIFGTCYPTAAKAGVAPAGPSGLAAAVAATAIPVLGIGGVTAARIPEVAKTGAAGVAAIGLFADAWLRDPGRFGDHVAALVAAFDSVTSPP